MKALVVFTRRTGLSVTAYEKGDEPVGNVEISPELLNDWQKAYFALQRAEDHIKAHLRVTNQWHDTSRGGSAAPKKGKSTNG